VKIFGLFYFERLFLKFVPEIRASISAISVFVAYGNAEIRLHIGVSKLVFGKLFAKRKVDIRLRMQAVIAPRRRRITVCRSDYNFHRRRAGNV
jgi:hypothetical protein